MIKHKQKIVHHTPQFQKGITLLDYINHIPPNIQQQQLEQSSEEDLSPYLYQIRNIQLTPFPINQIDEDNYQEDLSNYDLPINQHLTIVENQYHPQSTHLHKIISYEKQKIYSIDDKIRKIDNNQRFRIKNNSNSPKKIVSDHKNQMFRSLYGHSFVSNLNRQSDPSVFSSTIHNSFLKIGSQKQVSKKQINFKEKHKKNYNEVIKYQNITHNKYHNNFDLLNIRVDGVKDRLRERKNYHKS